jgi:hypothetical protein
MIEEVKYLLETQEYTSDSIKDIFSQFMNKNHIDSEEYFTLPFKLLRKLGDSIQSGTYFSKNFFIRKELW